MVYLKLDLNKSQDVVYSVSDINGKTVVQKSLGKVTSGYENIDVSGLNNGIYFVSVQFSNAPKVNKKIVVQR
jgi:flagellar hook assembly protein FlgD